jgi:hypothetical protein
MAQYARGLARVLLIFVTFTSSLGSGTSNSVEMFSKLTQICLKFLMIPGLSIRAFPQAAVMRVLLGPPPPSRNFEGVKNCIFHSCSIVSEEGLTVSLQSQRVTLSFGFPCQALSRFWNWALSASMQGHTHDPPPRLVSLTSTGSNCLATTWST